MPRPRSKLNRALPQYVYADKRRYIYRPPGQPGVRLCARDAPASEIWRRYEDLIGTDRRAQTVRWLCDQYLASDWFRRLAPRTRADYEASAAKVCAFPVEIDRRPATLGELYHSELTRGLVRQFLDAYPGPAQANRHRAMLSSAYAWAVEREIADTNPCRGVRANTERPRNRYVTDAEYQAVYAIAPRHVRAAMELAYLCVCRKAEVLSLRPAQILPEGIRIDRTKGSIPNIVGWSDRLRDAIALARGTVASATHVLCTDRGQPVSTPGFNTAWKRAKARAGADWTFHDIKAKGYTDHNGDPHRVAGHKTNLRSTYYRRLDVVEPTR
jgi:integrase